MRAGWMWDSSTVLWEARVEGLGIPPLMPGVQRIERPFPKRARLCCECTPHWQSMSHPTCMQAVGVVYWLAEASPERVKRPKPKQARQELRSSGHAITTTLANIQACHVGKQPAKLLQNQAKPQDQGGYESPVYQRPRAYLLGWEGETSQSAVP